MYEHELKRLAKYDKKNFPIFQRQLTKHRQQAQTVNQTTVAIIVANPCRSGVLLEPLTWAAYLTTLLYCSWPLSFF